MLTFCYGEYLLLGVALRATSLDDVAFQLRAVGRLVFNGPYQMCGRHILDRERDALRFEQRGDMLSGKLRKSLEAGMPIFLTEGKNSNSAETLKTMKGGGVSFVFIVGGTAAVSDNVRAQLQANGVRVLGRFAGTDAIETSELVAEFGVGSMQMSL